jgi:flagellar M-ring protein FliF
MSALTEQWSKASIAKRIGAVIAVLAIVALVVSASMWALRDRNQVLFSGLGAQDAGALVTELERLKVPFQVADSGATLLVDQDVVHQTRLKLMSQGVDLKGTVGLEIFGQNDFGMTEFTQKVNLQRALQGELARTIMAFDEVKHARVHLVLAEAGLLRRPGVKPKASVTLAVNGNAKLRADQVLGIQRLVAAAVPELEPAGVTVLDQQGVTLSKSTSAGDAEADNLGARFEIKRQIEAHLTKKAVEVLDRVFGPGQAIVTVDVVLDYDQIRVTREDVLGTRGRDGDTEGVVIRRRQNVPGSTAGAADPAGAPAVADDAARRAALREAPRPQAGTLDLEYVTGRKVEQVVSAPGSIRRISLGVVLPEGVDPVKLRRLSEVVSMSIGLDARRGDAIALYSVDPKRATRIEVGDAAAADPAPPASAMVPGPARNGAAAGSTGTVHPLPAPFAWLALLGVVSLGAAVWAARALGARASAPASLSDAERERLLAQMREWVKAG